MFGYLGSLESCVAGLPSATGREGLDDEGFGLVMLEVQGSIKV